MNNPAKAPFQEIPLNTVCMLADEYFYEVSLKWPRVPRGSVVKCLTSNPEVLGSSRIGSSGFFSWECPWARHFRAQPSTGGT